MRKRREGKSGEGRKIGDLIIPRAERGREGGRDDGWMDVSPSSRLSVVRGLFSQEARRGLLCIMASRHPRPISPSLTVAGGLPQPQEVTQSQGTMALLVPLISFRYVQKLATSITLLEGENGVSQCEDCFSSSRFAWERWYSWFVSPTLLRPSFLFRKPQCNVVHTAPISERQKKKPE